MNFAIKSALVAFFYVLNFVLTNQQLFGQQMVRNFDQNFARNPNFPTPLAFSNNNNNNNNNQQIPRRQQQQRPQFIPQLQPNFEPPMLIDPQIDTLVGNADRPPRIVSTRDNLESKIEVTFAVIKQQPFDVPADRRIQANFDDTLSDSRNELDDNVLPRRAGRRQRSRALQDDSNQNRGTQFEEVVPVSSLPAGGVETSGQGVVTNNEEVDGTGDAVQVSTGSDSSSSINSSSNRIALDLPEFALAGDSIELTCNHKLPVSRLYSVKWFKDSVEFYRFVPLNGLRAKSSLFIEDVRIDMSKSSSERLLLQNVTQKTSGTYRCEVVSGKCLLLLLFQKYIQ